VYLGKVQNVLPSMEAAFVDIGKGRNAVLYAGEVNWDAHGLSDTAPRKMGKRVPDLQARSHFQVAILYMYQAVA
jgi:Ribonuclease G/E